MAKTDLTPMVAKAQTGDREAMNQLMSECYETLYYYAYNTVKNEDLAADITQESCIEIINTLQNLRDPGAFRTWAGRIVYHKCAAHYRQSQDEVSLDAEDEGLTILERLPDESRGSLPEQVQEDKEFKKIIWQMLDSLPAEQRQAMMLYYFENMSVSEIAEIQGKPAGTIKSRLNYGRKAVIEQVEAYEKKTGTRLHSIAPLPLLLYFLFRENKAETAKAAAVLAQQAGKVAAAGAAAKVAAGTAVKGAAVKIVAGVAAAVAVLGAAAGGLGLLGGGDGNGEGQGAGIGGHSHTYTSKYQIVAEGHKGVCQCGEVDSVTAHSYENGLCICGSRKESEGLKITKYNGYCSVEDIGDCTDSVIVIPAYYEGQPVTSIGQSAFQGCKNITAVYIPETVTVIRQWAFYDCEGLTEVHFSEGLQKLENLVFIWCTSLKTISFPDSVVQMGHSIFNECSALEYVKLPANLQRLEQGVFSNCDSLKTVEMPGTLTYVGDKLFWHCTLLEELRFAGTKAQWGAVEKGYQNTWKPDGTSWSTDTGDFVVTCTDGTLSKSEALLYITE